MKKSYIALIIVVIVIVLIFANGYYKYTQLESKTKTIEAADFSITVPYMNNYTFQNNSINYYSYVVNDSNYTETIEYSKYLTEYSGFENYSDVIRYDDNRYNRANLTNISDNVTVYITSTDPIYYIGVKNMDGAYLTVKSKDKDDFIMMVNSIKEK